MKGVKGVKLVKTKLAKRLSRATGKAPGENQKEFRTILNAVIKQWDLRSPVDLMIANRMVSTWMKMRNVEESIKKYGIFFEDQDDKGTTKRVRANELVYYLKQLEADFRAYYRLLANANKNKGDEEPDDLLEWLGDGKKS